MAEESHFQGEHIPGVREPYNRQQCHTCSPHSVVDILKSSGLFAKQMPLAQGYYQVLSLQCMTSFAQLCWWKICVPFGLSNDSITD